MAVAFVLLGGPILAAYIIYQKKRLSTLGVVIFFSGMAAIGSGSLYASKIVFMNYTGGNFVLMLIGWGLGAALAYWAWNSFQQTPATTLPAQEK